MILDRKRKSESKYESAFNVAIRFGFCGDCRKKLDPGRCEGFDCYENSVKVIADALEKQIPKKYVEKVFKCKDLYGNDCSRIIHKCPVCGHAVYESANAYCHRCGQAILWEDKE